MYLHVSPASRRLFGWDRSGLEGHREDEFIHPDDVPSFYAARASMSARDGGVVMTYRLRHADGSYRWVEATSRHMEADGSTFIVATVRDIAERQKSDVLLQRRATTDALSGVANRTVLMDRLNHAIRRLGRARGLLAVLFLDLDRFKMIDDSLGHRVGDGVLQAMAERLLRFIRPADTLARLGGRRVRRGGRGRVGRAGGDRPRQTNRRDGSRAVSGGRGRVRVHGECRHRRHLRCSLQRRDLLQEADLALYRAKERGRDRVEAFDEDLRTRAVGRLGTERMLRRAIGERRLRLQYQPIFDLPSGRTVSAEALVRVLDSDAGLLQPAAFLDVAEEAGLLSTIDEWVLSEAVGQAASWHHRFGGNGFSGVAVNVTTRHLADAGFAQDVIALLDAQSLPHDHLHVEVTERVLMEASNSAMSGLRTLRDAGIKVGLDDFGTGYSSLAYLRQFPLDFVKIDGVFIHGLSVAAGEDAIVAAIIALAHAVGLYVVAEGVETAGQFDALHLLGCDCAQGFLLARPGAPDAVDALITTAPPPTPE